jgi:hypothetical protein
VILALVAPSLAVAVVSFGCSRETELRDESDAGSGFGADKLPEAGTLEEVPDAGFDQPELEACRERPRGDCVGVNDFPCDFPRWIATVASDCQVETDCQADGWIRVGMNAEGCAETIFMEHEDRAFAECMAESLAPFSCPCGEGAAEHFLGIDNDGCFEGCTDELPCVDGYHCISGFCVPD